MFLYYCDDYHIIRFLLSNSTFDKVVYHTNPPFSLPFRFCGGLILDIKRKMPFFVSDFTDAFHIQALSAILFIYLGTVTNAITFGGLLGDATDNMQVRGHAFEPRTVCGTIRACVLIVRRLNCLKIKIMYLSLTRAFWRASWAQRSPGACSACLGDSRSLFSAAQALCWCLNGCFSTSASMSPASFPSLETRRPGFFVPTRHISNECTEKTDG